MNEGLFGGTFNPLHNGHIGVIRYVKERFALNKIHIIPAAVPPHKTSKNLAPAQDRIEMIKQSVFHLPGLVESDVELKREGPSFTIDTVKFFLNNCRKNNKLFLIMGSDAFMDIGTWKKNDKLFHLITIIVMIRPGDCGESDAVASFIHTKISSEYRYNTNNCTFSHPEMKQVHICHVPEINISSTRIRERIQNHKAIDDLVPGPVAAIIKQKELYL